MDYSRLPAMTRQSIGPVIMVLAWFFAGAAITQSPVQIQTLGQIEPFQVGARAGIPFAMHPGQWRGTDAQTVANLMSDLPETGASSLLNRLAASVLMSPSDPPPNSANHTALASLRLASVYRLGLLDAVIDLAERSPGGLSDPENAAIATRAFLALGQDSNACETAMRLQNGRDAVFWLKVRAFCFAREERRAAAELTADLALEADPNDVDFLLALNRMLDKDMTPARPINALELAMARFAGAPIDLSDAPFALHSAMARAGGVVGLVAARRKAIAGLTNADRLARIYIQWPGLNTDDAQHTDDITQNTDDTLINDESLFAIALASEEGARPALIYQSANLARTDTGRARAIHEALRQEKELDGFLATSHLYAPLLQDLSHNEDIENAMRPLFAYALLAANRPADARVFVEPDDASMVRLFALFSGAPLVTLNDADIADAQRARLAYTDIMTLLALGTPLRDSHRNFLFGYTPDREEFAPCTAGARAAIADSAAQNAKAASVLRIALMLADSGFDRIAPQCGAAAIEAFKVLGYDDLARQAALEMMLGSRLHYSVDE